MFQFQPTHTAVKERQTKLKYVTSMQAYCNFPAQGCKQHAIMVFCESEWTR